jgi:hypothetical protein
MTSIPATIARIASLVAVASLAGTVASAAPKTAKTSKTTALATKPAVSAKAVLKFHKAPPSVRLDHDAQLAKKVKATPRLSKAQKARVFADAGIAIATAELAEPVVLDVRDPYHDPRTHLSFVGSTAIQPGVDGGIALIDTGGLLPTDLGINFNLLGGGSDDSSRPARAINFALVEFRAAADKHYLVDCIVAGEGQFVAQLVVDGALVPGGFTHGEGHATQLVPISASNRTAQVQVLSGAPWTMRACEITPVG